jgi:hypothetical protein
VFIFKNSKTKNIEVKVKSFTEDFKGELSLNLPKNWQFTPSNYSVNLKGKGNEKSYAFSVTPPNITETVVVEPNISADGILYNREIKQLDYEHIPLQTYLKPTKSNLVNININSTAKNIGYIKGAGDKIPENLESLGLSVSYIDIENIMNANELSEFDAVILGIRAFNTQEALATKNSILFNYVKNGGTLISQYNTTYSLLTEDVSPINLKISRDRVTDETATVKFLNQNHKVLNFPNKITANDFEDWIQERGLYFPNQWDDKFEPIFSIKDYGNALYDNDSEFSFFLSQYKIDRETFVGAMEWIDDMEWKIRSRSKWWDRSLW